jgi:hypothetical protein
MLVEDFSARKRHATAGRADFMLFGHNTNLKLGSFVFHVQTEDRGETHALIDTTVYYRGRVLHRRTNTYFDLLPMNEDRQQALRLRLDDQHRSVMEEIRSGALQLILPEDAPKPKSQAKVSAQTAVSAPRNLVLELANANSWLSGKRAKLQVMVRDADGAAVSAAKVKVDVEGSDGGVTHVGQTGAQGMTLIEFDLPRITSAEAAMVLSAETASGKGYLRFALRAKPRLATR